MVRAILDLTILVVLPCLLLAMIVAAVVTYRDKTDQRRRELDEYDRLEHERIEFLRRERGD